MITNNLKVRKISLEMNEYFQRVSKTKSPVLQKRKICEQNGTNYLKLKQNSKIRINIYFSRALYQPKSNVP